MLKFKLFMFCVSLVSIAGASQLPSYITPCQISLPKDEFSACVLQQTKTALPLFTQGVPELGIESMDPLALGDFTANAGTFKLREKNAILKGLGKVEVRDFKADLEKNVGQMKIFGNLILNCDYEAEGRVLLLPVTGNGKMTVKMYDAEISLKYKFKKVKGQDGKDHLQAYDLKATQTNGNVKFHLSNLLGGATIGDTINQVLNDNWRDLIKEVGPPHTKSISNKVNEIINKFYAQVPYEDLYA